jgi:hypothetical protein
MGFLDLQTVLFVASALVLFPFLTYCVTSTLFQRKVRSEACNKVPPTVPYQAPGIFHAFGLATIGPQKYLAQLVYVLHLSCQGRRTDTAQKRLWRIWSLLRQRGTTVFPRSMQVEAHEQGLCSIASNNTSRLSPRNV